MLIAGLQTSFFGFKDVIIQSLNCKIYGVQRCYFLDLLTSFGRFNDIILWSCRETFGVKGWHLADIVTLFYILKNVTFWILRRPLTDLRFHLMASRLLDFFGVKRCHYECPKSFCGFKDVILSPQGCKIFGVKRSQFTDLKGRSADIKRTF